jgi:hypothetical protein
MVGKYARIIIRKTCRGVYLVTEIIEIGSSLPAREQQTAGYQQYYQRQPKNSLSHLPLLLLEMKNPVVLQEFT